jgi:tetratricopeptide (TPR) repeat protein
VVHQGEIRKKDLIPHLGEEGKQGGHARRVMQSYETWLQGKPELRKHPPIKGLTGELQNLSGAQWQYALQHLRDLRLLAPLELAPSELATKDEDRPDTLDCHPLVREYFGEKLQQNHPEAWKEAHNRLYEYYKNLPEKELPDSLEEMEPLFAAVTHGCRAGRHYEVEIEVYWERINRGTEFYTTNKLGAFGADLAALSHFFEEPWRKPALELPDREKAMVLSWAGFRLRALGRLREAAEPMKAGMELSAQKNDWKGAAQDAGNLSELYLTLGEVAQAVEYARLSVEYADRSGDGFQRCGKRTTLADALHQAGELTEADRLFREAEQLQKEEQPQYPYLYSLQGFRFCDLLLSRGNMREVLERAAQTLEWAKTGGLSLLTLALDTLSLGRACWQQWQEQVTGGRSKGQGQGAGSSSSELYRKAEAYLHRAVEGLRESGNQDDLPRGLLARAAFYCSRGEFPKAEEDLAEALEIAERDGTNLFLADYHLEAGRLAVGEAKAEVKEKAKEKTKKIKTAREHLQTAADMVEKMGYGRRTREVEELRATLAEMEGSK